MPSLGNDYQADLHRIEAELTELEPKALAEPVRSAEATLYVYRLYARASLNGNLKELRAVEAAINQAIERLGPAEDLCLLKANLAFKLHRLAATKRALDMAPALTTRRLGQILLAEVAFQEGHYAEARASLEALAAADPTWDVLARIAHIESKMGDAAKADELYLQAQDELTAKEMRSFAWLELQRGVLDLSVGRLDAAMAHFNYADRCYSGYWMTAEHIAGALQSAPHYEEVLLLVDKPEVAEKLGKLYLETKPTRAEQLLSHAQTAYLASAACGEVHYYHHLAELFAGVPHSADEAVAWARKDLALRDNFNTQTAMAWALHCSGESAAAIPYLERALQSGVKDAAIYQKAAVIFAAAGRRGAAHRWEHRALRLNPSGALAHVH